MWFQPVEELIGMYPIPTPFIFHCNQEVVIFESYGTEIILNLDYLIGRFQFLSHCVFYYFPKITYPPQITFSPKTDKMTFKSIFKISVPDFNMPQCYTVIYDPCKKILQGDSQWYIDGQKYFLRKDSNNVVILCLNRHRLKDHNFVDDITVITRSGHEYPATKLLGK